MDIKNKIEIYSPLQNGNVYIDKQLEELIKLLFGLNIFPAETFMENNQTYFSIEFVCDDFDRFLTYSAMEINNNRKTIYNKVKNINQNFEKDTADWRIKLNIIDLKGDTDLTENHTFDYYMNSQVIRYIVSFPYEDYNLILEQFQEIKLLLYFQLGKNFIH